MRLLLEQSLHVHGRLRQQRGAAAADVGRGVLGVTPPGTPLRGATPVQAALPPPSSAVEAVAMLLGDLNKVPSTLGGPWPAAVHSTVTELGNALGTLRTLQLALCIQGSEGGLLGDAEGGGLAVRGDGSGALRGALHEALAQAQQAYTDGRPLH